MRVFTFVTLRRIAHTLLVAALLTSSGLLSAHHGGSHIMRVDKITCWHSNDDFPGGGGDEPYLKFQFNSIIWTGPECSPITDMYPGVEVDFWANEALYIMESDFGPDDTVGYVLMGPQAQQGEQTYTSVYWADGLGWLPNYSMDYEVHL